MAVALAVMFTVTAFGAASCFRPRTRDCAVRCGTGDACPDGARCSNGRCTGGADCSLPPLQPVCGACDVATVAASCRGNVALACEGGTWNARAVCTGDEPHCLDGACRECLPGTNRCREGCLQSCTDGRWTAELASCERCLPARQVPGRGLAAGWSHTCAALEGAAGNGRRIACWGDNQHGQLGLGHTRRHGDDPADFGAAPAPVDLGTGRTAVQVVAGGRHTCALLDTGQVKCWGDNGHGQLGLADTNNRGAAAGEMGDALPAVDLGRGRTAAALVAGGRHTCALLDTGQVKCWGDNTEGQLGLGDADDRGDQGCEMGDDLTSIDLGGARATEVGAGLAHSCAVLEGGSVACWGDNGRGQLGLGHDQDTRVPGAVSFGRRVTAVVALSLGAGFSCALERDGAVICWGSDNAGQLAAHADLLTHSSPELLSAIDVPGVVAAIATGASHTCALLQTGRMKCWGLNLFGQLGLGDAINRGRAAREPTDQPAIDLGIAGGGGPAAAIEIASGGDHTCARLEDGPLKCWGLNQAGQLGYGDTQARGDQPGELADAVRAVPISEGNGAPP